MIQLLVIITLIISGCATGPQAPCHDLAAEAAFGCLQTFHVLLERNIIGIRTSEVSLINDTCTDIGIRESDDCKREQ